MGQHLFKILLKKFPQHFRKFKLKRNALQMFPASASTWFSTSHSHYPLLCGVEFTWMCQNNFLNSLGEKKLLVKLLLNWITFSGSCNGFYSCFIKIVRALKVNFHSCLPRTPSVPNKFFKDFSMNGVLSTIRYIIYIFLSNVCLGSWNRNVDTWDTG